MTKERFAVLEIAQMLEEEVCFATTRRACEQVDLIGWQDTVDYILHYKNLSFLFKQPSQSIRHLRREGGEELLPGLRD